MSLFLLLLYIMLYIIMAIIVWFDKKDGKARHMGKLGEMPETEQMQYFADGAGGGGADLADGEVRA